LDYPKLLFISFPIFVLPIIIRMIANSRDISRQNAYIANPIDDPEISFITGDGWLEVQSIELPEGVVTEGFHLQAGVAIPERKTMLRALDRPEGGQPPPGMSTELPEKRISSGDEHGTGVGEATPLPVEHARVLLLEPLRVRALGPYVHSGAEFPLRLEGPEQRWPGTIYSSVIAFHWEIHVHAEWNGTSVRWVKPVIMPQTDEPVIIDELPLRGARSEDAKD